MNLTQKINPLAFSYHFSLGLIAFLIASFPKLIVLGFISLFLSLLFAGMKKQVKFSFHPVLMGFVLLYLAYVVGSFFTNNPHLAGNYLEYKLSFILIPILFSFRPRFKVETSYALIGLVLGIILVSIFGIAKAFTIYSTTGVFLTSFTSSSICIDHPTYYAAFVTVSSMGVLYYFRSKTIFFVKTWVYPFLFFGFIMLLLSYSMAAILFLFLLIALVVLRWLYVRINKWLTLSLLVFAPFLLFLSLTNLPAFKDEIKNTTDAFQAYLSNPSEFVKGHEGVPSGDKVRLIMWTVSASECLEHPFGVGTGNVDAALSEGLFKIGQEEMAQKDEHQEITYNPHNQFLQTTLEIGVFGLLILSFILGKSIQIGYQSNNWFLVFLVCNLIFNSLFESMLQRQSGIVFFTFFICLLVSSNTTNKFINQGINYK